MASKNTGLLKSRTRRVAAGLAAGASAIAIGACGNGEEAELAAERSPTPSRTSATSTPTAGTPTPTVTVTETVTPSADPTNAVNIPPTDVTLHGVKGGQVDDPFGSVEQIYTDGKSMADVADRTAETVMSIGSKITPEGDFTATVWARNDNPDLSIVSGTVTIGGNEYQMTSTGDEFPGPDAFELEIPCTDLTNSLNDAQTTTVEVELDNGGTATATSTHLMANRPAKESCFEIF